MAKPPPRAENFVAASPRNFGGRNVISWRRHEIQRASVRYAPYFRPYLEVASGYWPVIDFGWDCEQFERQFGP